MRLQYQALFAPFPQPPPTAAQITPAIQQQPSRPSQTVAATYLLCQSVFFVNTFPPFPATWADAAVQQFPARVPVQPATPPQQKPSVFFVNTFPPFPATWADAAAQSFPSKVPNQPAIPPWQHPSVFFVNPFTPLDPPLLGAVASQTFPAQVPVQPRQPASQHSSFFFVNTFPPFPAIWAGAAVQPLPDHVPLQPRTAPQQHPSLFFVNIFPAANPTRLYFPLDDTARVTPAIDAAWQFTSQYVSRRLADVKGSSADAIGTVIGPWTPGNKAIDRQYVSARIQTGTVFSTTNTIKCQMYTSEYNDLDNVDKSQIGIRIVSEDGLTVRATLLAIGNYFANAEFFNSAGNGRNCTFASNQALTANYTTVAGDRLVVETGYSDTGGATPKASAWWGETGADLPENETTSHSGSGDRAGWIEFSNQIAFLPEIPLVSQWQFQSLPNSVQPQPRLAAPSLFFVNTFPASAALGNDILALASHAYCDRQATPPQPVRDTTAFFVNIFPAFPETWASAAVQAFPSCVPVQPRLAPQQHSAVFFLNTFPAAAHPYTVPTAGVHPRYQISNTNGPTVASLQTRIAGTHVSYWNAMQSYINARIGNPGTYPNKYYLGDNSSSSKDAEYTTAYALSFLLDNSKTTHADKAIALALYAASLTYTTGLSHSQRQRTLAMAVVYDWCYNYSGFSSTDKRTIRNRIESDVAAMYLVSDTDFMWGTQHGDMEYSTASLLCIMEDDDGTGSTSNAVMRSEMDSMFTQRDNGTDAGCFFPVFRWFGSSDGGSHKGSGDVSYFARNEEFNLRCFPAVKSALNVDWYVSEPWFKLGLQWHLWHWRGDRTFHRQGEHEGQANYSANSQGHALIVADREGETAFGKACQWLADEMYAVANTAIWGPYEQYDILFRNTSRTSLKPTLTLNYSGNQMQFFDRAGKVCIREAGGWENNGLSVAISAPRYFTSGHQRHDAGNIDLYNDGEILLVQHGHYDPNQTTTYKDVTSPPDASKTGHRYSYMNQITAQNCVRIMHSSEPGSNAVESFQETMSSTSRFGTRNGASAVVIDNAGGQLWSKNTPVTDFEPNDLAVLKAEAKWNMATWPISPVETSQFCYVATDLSPWYWATKRTRYKRHFLWVKTGQIPGWNRPVILVWDDLITPLDGTFGKKTQVVHWQTTTQPTGTAASLTVTRNAARLYIKTLNPTVEMTQITDFISADGSTKYVPTVTHGAATTGQGDDSLLGVWRTEINQTSGNGTVSFLTVLFPANATDGAPPTPTLINDGSWIGATINGIDCKIAKGDTHSAQVVNPTVAPSMAGWYVLPSFPRFVQTLRQSPYFFSPVFPIAPPVPPPAALTGTPLACTGTPETGAEVSCGNSPQSGAEVGCGGTPETGTELSCP